MSPTAPSVPAGTILGHSYEYGLDINLGTTAVPVWQPVRRISDFNPTPVQKTQPAQSYDDFGADNNDVVGVTANLAFSILGNRASATGLYLPELEAIFTAAKGKGSVAVVEARWYHKPEVGTANPTDAGQGFFTVAAARANTGADGAVEKWNVTLTGKGSYTAITNPFTGWDAAVPTLLSATPSAAAVGAQVTITGTGFIGTTAVKFATVSATVFTVVADATIVAVMPAGTAGSAPIKVTNATGESDALAYTRGA